jgi:hypothetical protein
MFIQITNISNYSDYKYHICLFVTASHLVGWLLLVLCTFQRLNVRLKGQEVATSYLVPRAGRVVASVCGFFGPLL